MYLMRKMLHDCCEVNTIFFFFIIIITTNSESTREPDYIFQ